VWPALPPALRAATNDDNNNNNDDDKGGGNGSGGGGGGRNSAMPVYIVGDAPKDAFKLLHKHSK
jgi:hypothetical protein